MCEGDEFPVLKQKGLYASTILGDGNCLFRSLSDQLFGADKYHQLVRKLVVEYMKINSSYFSLFFDPSSTGDDVASIGRKTRSNKNGKRNKIKSNSNDSENGDGEDGYDNDNDNMLAWENYLERMGRDGTYGDNLEIVACARRFKVNITIYQENFCYIISASKDGDVKENFSQIEEIPLIVSKMLHIAYHSWEHYSSVRKINGSRTGPPDINDVESIKYNDTDSSSIPLWKFKIIESSLPYSASDALISKTLEENDGDVDKTIEILLEQDEDTNNDHDINDSQNEHENVHENELNEDNNDNNDSKKTINNLEQLKNNKDIITNTPKRKHKETNREKKERQKKEAKERKKAKNCKTAKHQDNDNNDNDNDSKKDLIKSVYI